MEIIPDFRSPLPSFTEPFLLNPLFQWEQTNTSYVRYGSTLQLYNGKTMRSDLSSVPFRTLPYSPFVTYH